MEHLNKEFNVPYYIFEEITEYIELTAKGYSKCMKWENIKSLLRLAVVNNKLTNEQAKFLEKEFYREFKA
jgi:CRISPR/Cas system-associated protein Cas5 (RAMP superfamily)